MNTEQPERKLSEKEWIEKMYEDIRSKMEIAVENAPAEEDVEKIRLINQEKIRIFLNGGSYEEVDEPGVVEFPTLIHFSVAIAVLQLSDEVAREMLQHENDHMVQALQEFPADKLTYTIQVLRRSEGVSIYPGVKMDFSKLTEQEVSDYRESLRRVIQAPESMSSTDKAQLGL